MLNFVKRISKDIFKKFGMNVISETRSLDYNLFKHTKFDFIIDVGGNRAQFIESVKPLIQKNTTIHAFEPIEKLHSEYKNNTKDFNVVMYNNLLSDTENYCEFQLHTNHDQSSSILRRTELCVTKFPYTSDSKSLKVRTVTLDAVLDTRNLIGKGLLKIDVQGAELKVLRGAKNTLKQIDTVISEINSQNLYEGQAEFHEIMEFFKLNDYKFCGVRDQKFDDKGILLYFDAVFRKTNA